MARNLHLTSVMIQTVPKTNRRTLLSGMLALAAAGVAARAVAQPLSALGDQSQTLQQMIDAAAARKEPLHLPPGEYLVSNIRLRDGTRLTGVPGATRIVYGGGGHLFKAEDVASIELTGLSIDGSDRALGADAQALVEMRRVANLVIDRCDIAGSSASAIALERVSGRVERCTITGAQDYGLYCVEGAGMQISGNSVTDCGNGGILVHRWEPGEDGAMVTGNRVARIAARSGGTGQNGNGINVFRADNVIVANNHVSDCAFSAIRANSASNVQIVANQCLRSGETAIYSEFSFEGAVISSNVVDGAAIGISIANLDEGGRMAVCNGNIVRNLVDHAPYEDDSPGFGIGISVEADTAVTGNVVEGAPLFGMMLGWGPFVRNVVATGNVVREAREGFAVSVVEGAGSVIIADNVIDGVERAVVGYRWADAATGDLAQGDDDSYPHLQVERNLVS
jgi:uncharacterized secreted repeat protein (TIGR03808 family)